MEQFVGTDDRVARGPSPAKTGRFGARTLGIGFVVVCLLLLTAAYAFTRPLEDFVAYWTAGHLLVIHHNPYSLPDVFHFQQGLGWKEPIPLIALNPPWALPFFAPIGFIQSYPLAWLGWVGVLACATAFSSRMLVDIYFGDVRLPEISDTTLYRCLFALTFYPVLLSLKFAQTAPFVLLGAAGFLFFDRKQRPLMAGIFVAMTAIKPNLIYLVWLALLFKAMQERRWKTLAAAAGLIAALTGIALLLDVHAFSEYWEVARGPLPNVHLPGIAGAFRTLLRTRDTFWLQWVPPSAGLVWFMFYWRKYRNDWKWAERLPTLVTASLLTTGWGWLFDQTLLAIPIIALAGHYAIERGRLPRNLVFVFTGLNITLILLAMASTPWSFVPAPIVIAFLLYREARTGNALSTDVHYSFVGSQS